MIPKIGAGFTSSRAPTLEPGEGPGPLPGDSVSRRADRGHRRAPHHLPGAVSAIDELRPGRPDRAEDALCRFTYVVQSTQIVLPTALWVTDNVGYDRLVLSACNPLYSAAQRIIVFARLHSVKPLGPA